MKFVVYIDVYFLTNLIFDFCILLLLCRIQNTRLRVFRLLFGSILGSIFAIVLLFCADVLPKEVSLLLQYGLLPCLILTTAFGATDKKSFFYRLLTFYAIGFFLGGALLFLKQERSSLKRLLTFGIGAAGMVWLILPMFLRRQIEKKQEYEVVVSLGEKRICGTALLDTGNRLREPISGKPVILADFQTVKPGLSKEALEALENREGFEGDLDRLIESFGGKLRIIPYHAVGTRSGILYGLEVKELKIWARGRWITKEDVMLGLVFEPLAAWGEYQFILHEDFMSG